MLDHLKKLFFFSVKYKKKGFIFDYSNDNIRRFRNILGNFNCGVYKFFNI